MAGQFDKESSVKNYEWHRERILREKKNPNSASLNRMAFNVKAIAKKHGAKAASEMLRELDSR